ncbi:ABC transporter permease [Rhodovibrio salinarum]|uniref:ABC transporter permease n=1 Tax=Rhodovibrio salinarum TaxID=1087 RepID=A0A934V1V1_9PROT|nr:ABC transporter permease [Rhodovibrio salinarum]MBK1698786.1 ABC transporter permease [Rhodovibrio salinarum]
MIWLRQLLLGRLVRLAWLLPLAAVGLFTLISLAPIDPVQAYVGDRTSLIGPEQRQAIAATWGLDRPAPARFATWLGGVLHGDLGRSLTFDAPVAEVIARRFPTSLALIGSAFAVSFILGTGLGIAAAAARGGIADRTIRTAAVVLTASPGFWIAILLIALFAVGLGWLPACCAAPPGLTAEETGWLDSLRHLVLPVATLSVVGTAPLILHTRQRLVAFLDGPAALHLRAHGLSWWRIAFGAGLRHAVGPALTLHLAGAGELFGGSVLAETVFAWPGLGQATVQAATGADASLLMGIGLATLLFVFCGNLLADIAAHLADPRLRQASA